MQREPRTFLSKAWSGGSLAAGTQNMFAAFVKQEQSLPNDERELQKRVEDSTGQCKSHSTITLRLYTYICLLMQELRQQLGMNPAGNAIKKVPALNIGLCTCRRSFLLLWLHEPGALSSRHDARHGPGGLLCLIIECTMLLRVALSRNL